MLIATWIVTFVIIVGIGVWSGTKIKSANQWSGGDKTMGPLTLGCVFAAWQIGGMAVVGAAQNGYTLGISGAWYSIAGSFYFIALALFAKLIRNNMPGDSVPIYLQKRFDTKTSRLYSYAWIVYGFLYIPYQLKTVASIIQIAIPGLNITLAMLIGLTIAVIYTSFSGMRGMSAVGRIVCFGIYILLIAFVLMTLPKFGGFTVMLSELPAEYSSMGNMPTQRIIAWILGGCLSTAVMQSVLQPLLAAKSASAARTGSILGYVLAAPICLLTATCGIFAKASGADLGDGATAFAYSIKTFSNPAFAGIIFAFATMIIAATMASSMVFKDGRPYLAIGAAGGPRIITGTLQGIVNAVDFGMLPEQLVRQPYLNCLTREQGLELEFGISEDTIRLLEQKGHRPVRVPVDQAMSTMLNSVMYVDGEYHAAGTQRVDGCGGALLSDGHMVLDGISQED